MDECFFFSQTHHGSITVKIHSCFFMLDLHEFYKDFGQKKF